jgi:signal transduction histidine kinase
MHRTQVRDDYRAMIDRPHLTVPEPARLTDDQLLEAARLVVVGELAGDVAHELNNPLFAILGLAELLLNDAEPGSRLAHRLELIQQTGLEMKQIVRSLLDFARDRSSEITVLTLPEIADRAVAVARRASSAKDVELVLDPGTGAALVQCNASRLVPIFVDLITKATRSLPHGGTVSIEFDSDGSSATAHVSAAGDEVELSLGAGLGLSIDRAAVEACGGTLAHRDMRFSLRLPLHHEERLAA